ncbi:hypothetical protein [Armatimonas sp.]|uniref:hypothetical protein n=1 Tax=Armatimonas sp. TaxID=1872638 RepID=UPI00374CA2E2
MEEELQRLRKQVATLSLAMSVLGCLLFVGAAWSGLLWMRASVRESFSPKCSPAEDGGVRLSAMDGPFVVTHVVAQGPRGRNIAALPEPFGWIESGSYEIPLTQLKKLHWYGADGKVPVEFPEGSTWRVLYLCPEYSPQKQTTP